MSLTHSGGNFNHQDTIEYVITPESDSMTRLLDESEVPPQTKADQRGPVSSSDCNTIWFPRLTLAQLMAMPPKQWLIDQVIGPGDLGMVFGESASGKTFVVIDLLFSACLGKTFAGRFGVVRPLTIAYAAGEGGSGLAQRFRAAAEQYGLGEKEISSNFSSRLFTYLDVPQLYQDDNPLNASRFVEEYKAAQAASECGSLDLLIVDTYHSATSGSDENSPQHTGKVLGQAKLIRERLGCAVIVIHHTNKGGKSERGSTALRAAMDVIIEVSAANGKRTMSCSKLKDGEQWLPQTFSLEQMVNSVYVEWGAIGASANQNKSDGRKSSTRVDVLRVLDRALSHPTGSKGNGWLVRIEIAEELGITSQNVGKANNSLKKDGLIEESQLERNGSSVLHARITEKGREFLQATQDE